MGERISNTTTLEKYDKRLFLVTSQSRCHKDYLKESEDFSFWKKHYKRPSVDFILLCITVTELFLVPEKLIYPRRQKNYLTTTTTKDTDQYLKTS